MNTQETDLLAITAKVEELDTSVAEPGEIFLTLDLIDSMQRRLKELESPLKEAAIKRLVEMGAVKIGKAVQIGQMLRWAGASVEKKSRDLRATAEGMMSACGGDWERFTDCLSTNAFKHGECKKVLIEAKTPKKFDELFSVTEKWKLNSEGEPVPELQSLNLDFVW